MSNATSTLSGESGSALVNNWCTAVRVDEIVYTGLQLVFKRSRQISPVRKWMFGWQIGVVKTMVGGERGYVGGILIDRDHKPPIRRVQCLHTILG